MTNNREPVSSLILYHYLKWSVVAPILRVYFRGRIYGGQKVPTQGPVVVVSNHASNLDPPILSCGVGRPVAFMAKEELFAVPLLKQWMKLYGAYPVKRQEADRSAIKAAMNALKEGWATGIFLQGTRTPDGRITSPKLGAAMIAAKTGASLLPVSLWGTEKIFSQGSKFPKSVPVTVRIGEPIAPPNSTQRDSLEAVTAKCVTAIAAMHDLGR
ncbi:MAG: 1-acyl-sn-glycerol-3-phosphate acyltransferase [Prochloron sp. SP5CPC1]|nr:1-acyl-sn-glycerol-3-phosphate acyltransferase [Candidatus Paraprochloron terpiosi SP5CPC1]